MKTQDRDTIIARRLLVLSLMSLLLLVACVSQHPIDSQTTCPCAPGWTCDPQAQVCVRESGLRIFVTSRVHNGDFLVDNRLSGQTVMEKADNFCQTDPSKPVTGTYKALLVDGVTRDALSPIDWVLKPDTAYFQSENDVRIATTTSTAIFPPYLEHFIHGSFGVDFTSLVWTGFSDGISFRADALTCRGWTFGQNLDYAPQGVCYGTDYGEAWWTNGGHVCSLEARIYCVEQ